jgi:hypothetical protein
MGIFAYREGAVYNIDIKHLDARFAWWAMRLTGELEDDALSVGAYSGLGVARSAERQ